ncbi:MAG: LysM peptidoglycan-binding domain-containing protein [Bdellovibrionota bacterium]
MDKKLALLLAVTLSAFMTSCAGQKPPSSLANQPAPIWIDEIDEYDTVALAEPIPSYENFGELYAEDPEVANYEKAPVIGAEVEDLIASEKLSEVPLPEVPLVLNQQVEKWMDYFQGRGRKYFVKWLGRSGRYVPMMKQILRENGIPEGLIYLSMIESGFSPNAYSRAKAVGPWQFMKFTGERYGLRVTYWIDERMDAEKSTLAAAQHLKDLYDEFDHWYLAAAGYNAGAGKISRAITRYQTEDFWEMSKYRYLKPETKNYVPKLLAASLLASDPEKYGFTDIEYQEPIPYEKVAAPEPVKLETIAQTLEVPLEALKDLNPELRRGVTPPDYPNYELKVPVGFQSKFEALYAQMPRHKIENIISYRVRSGDTLSGIAKKHGVYLSTITQYNNLKSTRMIRRGQEILIPIGDRQPAATKTASSSAPKTYKAVAVQNGVQYVVQSGDTLWTISRKFNVTVSELRKWNNIRRSSIFPGQKLTIGNQKKSSQSNQQARSETVAKAAS